MKRLTATTALAAIIGVPSTGDAQVSNHVSASLGLGLSAHSYSTHGTRVGFGLSFGIGLGFSLHDRDPYHDSYHFGLHDPLWPSVHCWDSFWYDPFQPCHGYFAVGYPAYDYWGWYSPWRFGFLGWPSPRYVRSHWWSPPFWTPFWADDYAWGFGGRGWGYGGWGYGYDRWDRYYPAYSPYYDYADPHTRVVRRSPLYGPRYKEYPAPPPVYVTDNGPERPVSRAVPRSVGPGGTFDGTNRDDLNRRGARLTDGPRTARPRTGTDVRTARPRTGADVRTSPPRVRARPQPSTRNTGQTPASRRPESTARPAPTRRPAPAARPAPSRRPAPAVRSAPSTRRPSPTVRSAPSTRRPSPAVRSAPSSRRPSPMVRSAPSRRPSPAVRSAPSRGSTPKARSAPSRTPPKARSAPSRAPKPKVRAAPRGSSGRKAPPRRPARRPGA